MDIQSRYQQIQKTTLRLIALITALLLVSCGGSSDTANNTTSFSISGTFTGLQGSITLQNNGTNALTLSATNNFTISTSVNDGSNYNITVLIQPNGQTCTVSNGSGTVNAANVSNIAVNCINIYSVGGSVTGLTGALLIQNNATDTTTITTNGAYTFNQKINTGNTYNVTILQNPTEQICSITNGSGEISTDNITNANIFCSTNNTTVTVSGSFSTAPLIQVDSDINDPFAVANVSNNLPSTAQIIANFSSVNGFLTKIATGKTIDQDRFSSSTDEFDIFKVALQKDQTLRLQVVNFAPGEVFQGDLDLYLYDTGLTLVAFSNTVTGFETLSVPANGEYFIEVYAFEGTSKYTLSLNNVTTQNTPAQSNSVNFRPGEAIIKFKPNTVVSHFKANNQLMRLSHNKTSRAAMASFDISNNTLAIARTAAPLNFIQKLAITNPKSYQKHQTLQQIKHLRQRADVKYAEPNYIYQASTVPNDTHYNLQWHYPAINLPQAWDITTGSRADTDVIVAVVDTGVFLEHSDFIGQLVPGYDFISDPAIAVDGDGIDNNPDDPGDGAQINSSSWHGTHVAGTVAASSNNNSGMAGVAWDAKVMPLRALGKGGGTSYDIMQSILYAARLTNDSGSIPTQQADIINLSLGGGGFSQAEQDAYTAVRDAGVIIVAAAGNENTAQLSYPASYDGVVSVSATDFANNRAPYSNFGSRIDVAAPGGNVGVDLNNDGYGDGVLSAIADDSSGSRNSQWKFYQGTSMAAPHVAGVFALMRAIHPTITPAEIDALLASSVITTDLGTEGHDDIYGHGLIDAFKAVQEAQKLAGGGTLPPQPALITADPNQLTLGATSNATLMLSNQGGETASILSFSDDANWLTVSAVDVDSNGLGTYQVSINRTDLSDSSYLGTITFNLCTGDALKIQVSMRIGVLNSASNAGKNYILLIDSNGNIIDQATPIDQGNGIFNYSFNNVPAGLYQIVGGSDIDNDLLICQLAETCGGFPTINALSNIEVINTDISGLDFVMDILSNFGSSSLSTDSNTKRPYAFQRLPANNKRLQQ